MYNIDFDICAIIVSIVVIVCMQVIKDRKRHENRVFELIVYNGLICSILDIVFVWGMNKPGSVNFPIVYLATTLYFIIHNGVIYLHYIYVNMVSGAFYKTPKTRYVILGIPYLFNVAILILNVFNNMIFSIDNNMNYVRGPWMIFIYGVSSFYAFMFIGHMFFYIKVIGARKAVILFTFILGGIIAIVFQYFHPKILIELFVQSIVYVSVMLTLDDEASHKVLEYNVYSRDTFKRDVNILIESNNKFGVLIIKFTNIDGYMSVLGIDQINASLKRVATWLKSIDKSAVVYSLNMGVFAVVLAGENRNKSEYFSYTLNTRFRDPWKINDIDIEYNVVIYEVSVPDNLNRVEELLLLGNVETGNGQRLTFISGNGLEEIKRRLKIERAVRKALITNQFKVYYQPIWDRKNNKIKSAEALLRLYDPDIGAINPEEFIRTAEKNGSIIGIGEFVFKDVCRFLGTNDVKGLGIDYVEVNLSPVQCMQRDLTDRFTDIIKKYNVDVTMLNLEITETAAVENTEVMKRTIKKLRDLGFATSIDDFGAGFASMSSVFNIDFKLLKIDREILWRALEDEEAMIMLKNTIEMGKRMGRKIVQEGVETREQKELMEELGCDYCQGFYFSRPIPEDEFIEYVKRFNGIDN